MDTFSATAASSETTAPAKSQVVEASWSESVVTAIPTALGKVDTLSPAEQARFEECEKILEDGWQSFIRVGEALAQIRRERLYRTQFNSFDDYCRQKWEYGRRQVDRLIAAAQVVTALRPTWSHRLPFRESQLRLLAGLPPDMMNAVWGDSVEKAGKKRVTARIITGVLQEYKFVPKPAKEELKACVNKQEVRRRIETALSELMLLVHKGAEQQDVLAKLEELHGHIYLLFQPTGRRTKGGKRK